MSQTCTNMHQKLIMHVYKWLMNGWGEFSTVVLYVVIFPWKITESAMCNFSDINWNLREALYKMYCNNSNWFTCVVHDFNTWMFIHFTYCQNLIKRNIYCYDNNQFSRILLAVLMEKQHLFMTDRHISTNMHLIVCSGGIQINTNFCLTATPRNLNIKNHLLLIISHD